MRDIDDLTTVILVLLISLLTAIMGYVVGYNMMQQDAVDKNAAKWVVDNRGHVSLEWLNK